MRSATLKSLVARISQRDVGSSVSLHNHARGDERVVKQGGGRTGRLDGYSEIFIGVQGVELQPAYSRILPGVYAVSTPGSSAIPFLITPHCSLATRTNANAQTPPAHLRW
jgi:hypothetical protein